MFLEEGKKLGFGCLRLPHIDPDDPSDVDMEQLCAMVDRFLAAGFRYFDTAYSYLDYKSESFMRQALVERHPRESFWLTTKMPCLEMKEDSNPLQYFEEQLMKCGVDYFDCYLLHGLNARTYALAQKLGCFQLLQELKGQGRIRATGFSFHDSAAVLDQILREHPEVDVVQIQLNYLDWDHAVIQSRLCHDVCVRHGKPIIVMEPVKGGTLAAVPVQAQQMMERHAPGHSPASWAIRFAASQPGVAMVLSGMSNLEQVEDNISYMKDFQPLDEQEEQILRQCSAILRQEVSIPCTGCSYCTSGCPQGIPIPRYFSLYNQHRQDGWQAEAKARYAALAENHGKASQCIGCGQCESKCPQKLPIIRHLAQVAQTLEA